MRYFQSITMAASIKEKLSVVRNLGKINVGQDLEGKIESLGYRRTNDEHEAWRIYTKKAEVGNDFVAFCGNREEASVVKGKYGVVLDFVKEDLETIADVLDSKYSRLSRFGTHEQILFIPRVVACLATYGAIRYLEGYIHSHGINLSEPAKAFALLAGGLIGGLLSYSVLGSILPSNKYFTKTALKLSDRALEYRYGDSAVEELKSEIEKNEVEEEKVTKREASIKVPEIIVKRKIPELEDKVYSSVTKGVIYNGLVFEPIAPRETGRDKKELFYFNSSQERLVGAGYERHPLASEAFGLICVYLDDQRRPNNVLNQEQTEVVEDMLKNYGELFAQAIKTEQKSKNKKLFVYELVTSLPRKTNDTGYTEKGMEYSGKIKEFDVSDLALGNYYYYKHIYENHDALIAYFTSRNFEQLPEEIKETGGIYISYPNNILPVGRGVFDSDRFVISGYNYGGRASRGVRVAPKNRHCVNSKSKMITLQQF